MRQCQLHIRSSKSSNNTVIPPAYHGFFGCLFTVVVHLYIQITSKSLLLFGTIGLESLSCTINKCIPSSQAVQNHCYGHGLRIIVTSKRKCEFSERGLPMRDRSILCVCIVLPFDGAFVESTSILRLEITALSCAFCVNVDNRTCYPICLILLCLDLTL